ncbi:hypothetical protein PR003_g9147 [Phytophthora rubi]|uniref:Uncharacterized protein n=1 Tax=Phytophthora rubi TaxID=129364 RepID=A0A6A3MMY7_9STRA|nr:hypothetical protein PR002_g10152 [Phytophthora rubi]KAE9044627.1 hypothetical protein PR001_g5295 [Phytophthora rubi]KAE9343081.1 hypothetical protein PR003_g9147 [Phytophthora rubi]
MIFLAGACIRLGTTCAGRALGRHVALKGDAKAQIMCVPSGSVQREYEESG